MQVRLFCLNLVFTIFARISIHQRKTSSRNETSSSAPRKLTMEAITTETGIFALTELSITFALKTLIWVSMTRRVRSQKVTSNGFTVMVMAESSQSKSSSFTSGRSDGASSSRKCSSAPPRARMWTSAATTRNATRIPKTPTMTAGVTAPVFLPGTNGRKPWNKTENSRYFRATASWASHERNWLKAKLEHQKRLTARKTKKIVFE